MSPEERFSFLLRGAWRGGSIKVILRCLLCLRCVCRCREASSNGVVIILNKDLSGAYVTQLTACLSRSCIYLPTKMILWSCWHNNLPGAARESLCNSPTDRRINIFSLRLIKNSSVDGPRWIFFAHSRAHTPESRTHRCHRCREALKPDSHPWASRIFADKLFYRARSKTDEQRLKIYRQTAAQHRHDLRRTGICIQLYEIMIRSRIDLWQFSVALSTTRLHSRCPFLCLQFWKLCKQSTYFRLDP